MHHLDRVQGKVYTAERQLRVLLCVRLWLWRRCVVPPVDEICVQQTPRNPCPFRSPIITDQIQYN